MPDYKLSALIRQGLKRNLAPVTDGHFYHIADDAPRMYVDDKGDAIGACAIGCAKIGLADITDKRRVSSLHGYVPSRPEAEASFVKEATMLINKDSLQKHGFSRYTYAIDLSTAIITLNDKQVLTREQIADLLDKHDL